MLSQLVVESCLPRSPVILVGDPVVLADADDPPDTPELVVDGPAGRYLVARRPTAARSSGSPAPARGWGLSVVFQPDQLDRPGYTAEIDCPSGRLVVGAPEAIAAWGPDVEPDDHLCAQARAHRPGRRYCGLIVVARVPTGRHPI